MVKNSRETSRYIGVTLFITPTDSLTITGDNSTLPGYEQH